MLQCPNFCCFQKNGGRSERKKRKQGKTKKRKKERKQEKKKGGNQEEQCRRHQSMLLQVGEHHYRPNLPAQSLTNWGCERNASGRRYGRCTPTSASPPSTAVGIIESAAAAAAAARSIVSGTIDPAAAAAAETQPAHAYAPRSICGKRIATATATSATPGDDAIVAVAISSKPLVPATAKIHVLAAKAIRVQQWPRQIQGQQAYQWTVLSAQLSARNHVTWGQPTQYGHYGQPNWGQSMPQYVPPVAPFRSNLSPLASLSHQATKGIGVKTLGLR